MSSNGLPEFLMSFPWFAWVAIVAIVGGTVARIVAQSQRHFERMEMIRQGIHPSDRKPTMLEL